MLTIEEDQVWLLGFCYAGRWATFSLQQLKMKVAKLIQTKTTPFQRRVLGSSWWYLFKRRHLELNICQVEGLDIN
jgi:hypothetical protein